MKACALIGLYMMAEESAFRSDSDFSPIRRHVEVWLPKNLVWSSGGDHWAGSEGTSSLEHYEHNVDNLDLEVVGQNWSSEVVSLFLEDCAVGRVALSSHMAMDLLCQEMRDVCWVTSKSRSSPLSLCSVPV